MKLIKRTQPEKGMVCRLKENGEVLIDDFKAGTTILWNKNCPYENKYLEIIGKIGHNFEIKNGKLIKLKLPDVSIDDVFEDDDGIILIRKTSEFGNYIHILYDDFQSDCLELREFKNSKFKHKGNLAYSHKIEGGV